MNLEELYQYMELALLKNIAKRIGNGKDVSRVEPFQWQIAKMMELGPLRREQIAVITEYTELTEKAMLDLVGTSANSVIEMVDEEADVTRAIGNNVVNSIEFLQKQAINRLNLLNASLLEYSNQVYRDMVTRSAVEMLSGTKSIQKAISDSVSSIASKGMPALVDKAGRTWTLETYSRMLMQNTQKNVAKEIKYDRMDELKIDLVYVDGHAGSRPSHYDFQFKVYSRSGNSDKYPPLSETGYGTVAGIEGVNCHHRIHIYHEGITDLNKRREMFESSEEENARQYALIQEQRRLERQVRKAKREFEVQKALGVDDDILKDYRLKVKRAQAQSKAFADKYDGMIHGLNLRRKYDREKIGQVVNHHINYAKAIDKMSYKGDNVIYEKESIISEMKTSPIGKKMLEHIETSAVRIEFVNTKQPHTNRGDQNGNDIKIFTTNIFSERVAAQTIIHEMAHYRYNIGYCQHAEAICFAMEKMHLLKRDYLTEDEWQQMVKLAVENYPEFEWESGGYGDFEQFNFVRKNNIND